MDPYAAKYQKITYRVHLHLRLGRKNGIRSLLLLLIASTKEIHGCALYSIGWIVWTRRLMGRKRKEGVDKRKVDTSSRRATCDLRVVGRRDNNP